MDLALELGQPAELLARSMPERELRRWLRYHRKKMLPTQRLELYLAQIAQLIAITMGGRADATISDYLIELRPTAAAVPEVEVDVNELREAFAYRPRKKRS